VTPVGPGAAQGLEGVHGAFCVQGVQTPDGEQTWLVPQTVPAAFEVRSVQTGAPVPQAMVAVAVHGLPEVDGQVAPWVHAVQTPAPHTWFRPQAVPLATGPPSTHTGPVAPQVTVPVMQGFAGVHVAPALQGTHWPVEVQASPAPHDVPAAAKAVSAQAGAPEAQEMADAVAQGFPELQVPPATQVLHAPEMEQTSPAPQTAPAGWKSRSVQTGVPLEHS